MSRSFFLYQVPLLLWVVIIAAVSSIPKLSIISSPLGVDKLVHAAIFGVLCWLAWRAFRFQTRSLILREWALLAAFLFTVLYGIVDELHQYYVPGRTSDLLDVAADGGGALLYVVWHRIRFRDRGGWPASNGPPSVDKG
jgi:hypothetical protein